MITQILIFTDGRQETWEAVRFGAWLAGRLHLPAVLAGVSEGPTDSERLESLFFDAVSELQGAGADYSLELHPGPLKKVIVSKVQGPNSLVVAGPHERPRAWLGKGQFFSDLMEAVPAPLLYVTQARTPVRKILVCVGGLGYELTSERLGMDIARAAGAEVCFLYVVPPIDLDYPSTKTVREHQKDLSETETLPGRGLRRALESARELELNASTKVRSGNIIQEIQQEVKEGGYDLVCMGSPYSAHGLRHLYTPNVTAEVAESISIPLLTARYEQ